MIIKKTFKTKSGNSYPPNILGESPISESRNYQKLLEKLRESEDRYRDLVEYGQYIICTHDLKGQILSANQEAVKLLGFDQSVLLKKNLREILAPEVRDKFNDYLEKIQRDGVAKGLMLVQAGKGEKRIWEYNNSLRKHGVDEPMVRAMAHDITHRKRSEKALLNAAQQWRTTFDSITDMVSLLDLEGRILRCNRAMKNFVRKPFNEIINHSCWEIMLGTPTPIDGCPFSRMKETLHRETIILSMNDRWFNISIDPILDESHHLIGAVNIISDITGQKKTEEEINRNYDVQTTINSLLSLPLKDIPLEEILYHSLDLVLSIPWLAFESRGGIFLIGDEPETLVMTVQKGLAAPIREACTKVPFGKCLCGRAASTAEIQFADCIDDRHETTYEGISPHGHYCVPILFSGKLLGVINIYIREGHLRNQREEEFLTAIANAIAGIIQHKHVEKEMIMLQEQFHQSQKMQAIGQLAGGVAHDFNNLLTVIRGYSDLMLSSLDQTNPLYPDTLEIKNASEKAESLTRQLLAFSRKQVIQPKVVNLNTLVSNMDKMLRRLIGEHIELVTCLTENLGRVKVDPGQMEQVIINLAVNAKDAMLKGGRLTIETTNVELNEEYARAHIEVEPGRYVMISVSDTGIGMPQKVKEHIFEPFFTTKEQGKGTGLGLSTVYGIVKQSGGHIWVYSEPGQGTVFKIYLPRVEEEMDATDIGPSLPKPLHGSETILLVEDEEVVRRVVVTILQKKGYNVFEAINSEEALSLVKEKNGEPIHLMVTDVVMPGMSGPELAKHLTSLHHETKVLFMSGYTDNAIIHHEILKYGMPYLQKPFTQDSLARKVREVLDGC
ncbi:MAG: PAS domain S-box protein [Deltaproteobacteria bacterium]|nr:PAS domain S-box protein [Deltaproteobacteria bacterium]